MPPDRPSTTSARYGTSSGPTERRSADPRRGILRDALDIALASGAYAISFGAISTAAGLSLIQTCALSLLMLTGASQFALVGVVGAGGSIWDGALAAGLLGSRYTLYGLRISEILAVRGWCRDSASPLLL